MASAGREGSRRRRLSHSLCPCLWSAWNNIILERGRRRHKDARDTSGFRHQARREASDQWASRWRKLFNPFTTRTKMHFEIH